MTPFDRVSAQLATIRYKPGWVFRAEDLGERIAIVLEPPPLHDSRRDGEHWMHAMAPTPCCGDGVEIRMTRYLTVRPQEALILLGMVENLVWDLARCMELHELGEWFTVGGQRPHDPHALPDGRQCE